MQDKLNLTVRDFSARDTARTSRVYGEAILAVARRFPQIVCLSADLTTSTETDLFRDTFPERFFQAGIAEANMIGVAGGMARSGDIPFVHSFSVFVTRRCYDQLSMQAVYPRLPIKIVGMLPGLSTPLGVSHQAIDDIALMRALPGMTVIEPSSPGQIAGAVEFAVKVDGPVYLRLRRFPEADAEATGTCFEPWCVHDAGDDGLILACGMMVETARSAARKLAEAGMFVTVAEVPLVKPLSLELVELIRRFRVVVTAENHSVIGGLGSAVAELIADHAIGCGFERVGVKDTFAEGASTPYLFKRYGLDDEAIGQACLRARAKLS